MGGSSGGNLSFPLQFMDHWESYDSGLISKVTEWNRWGRACAAGLENWQEDAELHSHHSVRRRIPLRTNDGGGSNPIRTYKKSNPSCAFYLPSCQLEEIWGTPWGSLNSYFWESRAVSQCVVRSGYRPPKCHLWIYIWLSYRIRRFGVVSAWMDGLLAGFVDVTPSFRQPATVENLINSERGEKYKPHTRKRRS